MLLIEDLTFPFPDFLGCYSLQVNDGSFLGLVGPSGGGKTTLLDGIAGHLKPSAGRLLFDGVDLLPLAPGERPIATIFQDNNLFPDLTAAENAGLGLRPSLRLSPQERERVDAALAAVELAGYGPRRPAAMSGGERQRVALARALVSGRRLLLLDEAFSGLDPGLRKAMLALVNGLRQQHGLTVIASMHTPSDLLGLADSLAFIADGRVHFAGSPEGFFASADDPLIRRYLGSP